VVGKATYVAAAAIAALALVAWNLRETWPLLVIAFLIIALFGGYFVGVLWFAHKHPGTALLEGAELIQWRQLDVAASNMPRSIDVRPSEPPIIDSTNDNHNHG
jgi:hypothetical protein